MTNTEIAEAIFKRLCLEKRAQPGGEWDKSNIPMAKKIMIKAIADELARINKEALGATDKAKTIYALYPRKIAPARACKAIEKAIKLHGYEHVKERTIAYANAVGCWSHDWRFRGTAGSDIVPHPTTWFNGGRYDDEPKEWVGDRKYYTNPNPVEELAIPPKWQNTLSIRYPDFEADGNGVKRIATGFHLGWDDLPGYMKKELAG